MGYKVVLLGTTSVGKTSLVKTLLGQPFDEEEKSTITEELHKVAITTSSGETVELDIHDNAGESLHA